MKQFTVIMCLLASTVISAEVFRSVGPDGQVLFSDQPSHGAERVEVRPESSVNLPAVEAGSEADDESQEQAELFVYTAFSITSPGNEEGVRANNGNVTVQLALQPPLQPGHAIVMAVDGEDGEADKNSTSLSIGLTNLSRGRHTIDATVLNRAGEPMVRTTPVSFFVLRAAGG